MFRSRAFGWTSASLLLFQNKAWPIKFSATSKETMPIIAALPFNISLFVLKMANSLLSSKLSCVNFGVIVPKVEMAMTNAIKEKFCASMTCVGTPETTFAGKSNSKASFFVMISPAMAETKPTIAARPLMSCAVSLSLLLLFTSVRERERSDVFRNVNPAIKTSIESSSTGEKRHPRNDAEREIKRDIARVHA